MLQARSKTLARSSKLATNTLVLLLGLCIAVAGWAETPELSPEQVIREQLQAFDRGDSVRAYEFASESIKQAFPDAEVFMAMVEAQYGVLINSRSLQFSHPQPLSPGVVIQELNLLDRRGEGWRALYRLGLDGTEWRIEGVSLARIRQQVI